MADFNYTKGLEALGKKLVDLVGDTIKVVLCTSAYSENSSTDQYLSDIAGGARVATATLSGKSFTDAVFDADDVTFPTVAGGSTVTHLVIYQDTGTEGTSRLIRHVSSYSGFPFTTDGLSIDMAWPNDSHKIFDLVNA